MRIKFFSGALSGAVSIVIIFATIVIVAMGYFSIAAGNISAVQSNEVLDWNRKFHYLDGRGHEFLAHMDTFLLRAQNLTNEYIESGSYRRLTHPDLPLEMQTFIREGHTADGSEAFFEQIIEMLFFFYADRELEQLREIYPSVIITVPSEYANGFVNVRGLLGDITLTHPQAQEMHLSIVVSVVNYNTFRAAQRAGNTDATRYRITSWRLWESPAEDL